MLSTMIYAPGDIRLDQVARPQIVTGHDAIVRVSAACVCGSDLWPYRGINDVTGPHGIGHEAVGVVEEVGQEVTSVAVGDFVIVPFSLNCGLCQACRQGYPSACDQVTFFGGPDRDGIVNPGCQSQVIRVPLAQASLFKVPFTESEVTEGGLLPHLLTLSDVMSTGYHAAFSAQVAAGDTVAVVGDGAVGLCAVIAAKLRGASRIITMSRHPQRAALARSFGATDVVEQRGDEAADAVRELLGGDLADAALECVGTKESMDQALSVVRGGGRVGFVGVPHGVDVDISRMFSRNLTLGGGMASARRYMEELLPHVLDGSIAPGRVFDLTLPLDQVSDAYAAMDQRTATKVMLLP